MMSRGDSEGVFQFESAGMKRVLQNLRPDSFEDLIAVISLYRPDRWNPSHGISTTATIPIRCATATRCLNRFSG